MNKIINFSGILLSLFLLAACYEKEENYEYSPKTKLEINGVDDLYEKVAMVDTLHIEPTVVVSNPNHELEYEWSIFVYYGDAASAPEKVPVKVIGKERVLDYFIVEKPQAYNVVLKVVNKTTTQETYAMTRLNVSNEFSQGFYVLKEVNGESDLDLHLPSEEIIPDILYQKNGKRIGGSPNSLSVLMKYSYIDTETSNKVPTTSLTVATKNEFHILDIADLSSIYTHDNMFYEAQAPMEESLFACFTYYGATYFSDKGVYFSSYDLIWSNGGSGKFPLAATIAGGCRPNINILAEQTKVYFFDELNGRFLFSDHNGYVKTFDDENKDGIVPDYTPNGINHKLVFFGRNKIGSNTGNGFALMQDKTDIQKLYLYELKLTGKTNNPIVGIKEITGQKLNKATLYATNELLARVIYFVADGQLYTYKVDDDTEVSLTLQGIGENEEIVYIRNRYWEGSEADKDNFNYLAVGTQKAGKYKIYLYELVGSAPTGVPVRVLEGEGRMVSLQYVTPDFTATNGNKYPLSY